MAIFRSRELSVRLVEAETQKPLGELAVGPELAHYINIQMTFSPDGRMLALGVGKTIRLWDVKTRQPLDAPLQNRETVYGMAFSPDGKVLASASGKDILLWDVESRKLQDLSLRGHTDKVINMAFSPNGQMLASGSHDGTIRLWNVTTHQSLGPPLTDVEGAIDSVAFSPDGHYLAAFTGDGLVRLWDPQTLQFLCQLYPERGLSHHVDIAFNPDNNNLMVYSYPELRVWDISPASLLQRACRVANRNLTKAEWQQYLPDEPYRKTCPDLLLPEK